MSLICWICFGAAMIVIVPIVFTAIGNRSGMKLDRIYEKDGLRKDRRRLMRIDGVRYIPVPEVKFAAGIISVLINFLLIAYILIR